MNKSHEVAELWHQIAMVKSSAQNLAHRPSWGAWDGIASPGYVGPRYQGLLFIANNPGSGGPEPSVSERRLFSALESLRKSPEGFDAYNSIHGEVMWEWKICRYINGLGIGRDAFAFINLVKWRGNLTAALRRESWPWTERQLQLLSPNRIVVLGKGPFGEFSRLYAGSCRVDWIERTIGDTYETEQAKQQISDLRRDLQG